ncbi:hypothetical protein J5X84_27625 [Streptosporangiaceae bacterium NEAU-GS5]|nr:hypothetical protein [Streptosporangiaceae bacterium NEAU-GS5]
MGHAREPSLIVGHRVLCYAASGGLGWVFVDCFTLPGARYVPGAGRLEREADDDPLVRAVRRPAADFESGLVLTLYGKVLRWGPGWWVRRGGVVEPAGVGEATRPAPPGLAGTPG